ncbi:MAG: helix-turn-helix domain-containing protein [Pyrinomonadaceae bacterium]
MTIEKQEFNPEDLITKAQAAKLRGVSRTAIHDLVKRGKFKIFKIAGREFLSKKEVESFEPHKGGRPSTKSNKE